MVVKWVFEDVYQSCSAPYEYTFPINPNTGGTPTITKTINTISSGAGSNKGIILQEGQSGVAEMSFSGVILTQGHLEALERWFDKRALLEIRDDLGRRFRGVFSTFDPSREYRSRNPWYHTFSAKFIVSGYRTAPSLEHPEGEDRYGRF